MKMPQGIVVVLVAFALVMLAVGPEGAASAVVGPCNPTLLTPCAGPVLFGGAVPAACCAQLRAQQACLCQYARSPNYGDYIRSPNARHLFAACRLPVPRC